MAGDDDAEIATQLSNPISTLTRVSVQNNFDYGAGPSGEGFQWKANIMPVLPVTFKDWNMISRSELPLIYQEDVAGGESRTGFGDIVTSLFFTDQKPIGEFSWGAGPVFLLPTATDHVLGLGKWGVGPTAAFVKQGGGWTMGALFNHIWSFAGDDDKDQVSTTLIQPFIGYTTANQTTFSFNAESKYDWNHDHWIIPLNFGVAQLMKFGNTPIQIQLGYRTYTTALPEGPSWGWRLDFTFPFPK